MEAGWKLDGGGMEAGWRRDGIADNLVGQLKQAKAKFVATMAGRTWLHRASNATQEIQKLHSNVKAFETHMDDELRTEEDRQLRAQIEREIEASDKNLSYDEQFLLECKIEGSEDQEPSQSKRMSPTAASRRFSRTKSASPTPPVRPGAAGPAGVISGADQLSPLKMRSIEAERSRIAADARKKLQSFVTKQRRAWGALKAIKGRTASLALAPTTTAPGGGNLAPVSTPQQGLPFTPSTAKIRAAKSAGDAGKGAKSLDRMLESKSRTGEKANPARAKRNMSIMGTMRHHEANTPAKKHAGSSLGKHAHLNVGRLKQGSQTATSPRHGKRKSRLLPSVTKDFQRTLASASSMPVLPDLLMRDKVTIEAPTINDVRPWDKLVVEGRADREREYDAQALREFTAAIKEAPPGLNMKPLFERAMTYMKIGEHAKARKDLTRCIHYFPDDERPHFKRAIANMYLERIDEALADFGSAIRLKPFLIDSYQNRGLLYRRMGYYAMARQDYECVRLIQAGNARLRHGKIEAIRRGPNRFEHLAGAEEGQQQRQEEEQPAEATANSDIKKQASLTAGVRRGDAAANVREGERQQRKSSSVSPTSAQLNSLAGSVSLAQSDERRAREAFRIRDALTTAGDERDQDHIDLLVSKSASVPYLQRFTTEFLRTLWQHLSYEKVPTSSVLVKEGDPSNKFYILLAGRCRIMKRPQLDRDDEEEEPMTLGYLEAGGSFGEIALLRGIPRNASVVAVEPTEVLWLTKAKPIKK